MIKLISHFVPLNHFTLKVTCMVHHDRPACLEISRLAFQTAGDILLIVRKRKKGSLDAREPGLKKARPSSRPSNAYRITRENDEDPLLPDLWVVPLSPHSRKKHSLDYSLNGSFEVDATSIERKCLLSLTSRTVLSFHGLDGQWHFFYWLEAFEKEEELSRMKVENWTTRDCKR